MTATEATLALVCCASVLIHLNRCRALAWIGERPRSLAHAGAVFAAAAVVAATTGAFHALGALAVAGSVLTGASSMQDPAGHDTADELAVVWLWVLGIGVLFDYRPSGGIVLALLGVTHTFSALQKLRSPTWRRELPLRGVVGAGFIGPWSGPALRLEQRVGERARLTLIALQGCSIALCVLPPPFRTFWLAGVILFHAWTFLVTSIWSFAVLAICLVPLVVMTK